MSTLPETEEEVMAGTDQPGESFKDYTPKQREDAHTLPDGSFPIEDCADLKNAIQSIGRAKDPAKAKAHIRRRKSALGCPDVDLPWSSVTVDAASQGGFLEISEELFDAAYAEDRITEVGLREDGAIIYDLTAATSLQERQKNAVVVALPKKGHAIHDIGPEEKHTTLAFLGEHKGDMGDIHDHVKSIADTMAPFDAKVSGHAELGPDKAKVALMEHPSLAEARSRTLLHPDVADAVQKADTHPHFVPHMTLGYPDPEDAKEGPEDTPADKTGTDPEDNAEGPEPDVSQLPDSVPFDRLAVWHGDKRTEFPLKGKKAPVEPAESEGGQMSQQTQTWAQIAAERFTSLAVEPEAAPTEPVEPTELEQAEGGTVPFHVILAPETVASGDGRTFSKDALTHRPLPLPFTWQKQSAEGHDGNVTVARLERIKKVMLPSVDTGELVPMQVGDGHFLASVPEADEAVGMIAEFGRFGVSVDGDRAVASVDEEAGQVEFSEARTSSACIVAIPAFAEAWIALGDAPPEWGMDEPDDIAPMEAMTASVETFRRGPGWITNPVATKRIHDYWTRPGEAGFIQVGWGTPNDFYRCRDGVGKELAKHSPEDLRFINQICSQWHHDALGVWPGQEAAGDVVPFARDTMDLTDTEAAPALSLVASGGLRAPADWFSMPEPDQVTPLKVTEAGQVYGHIAQWGTCHIGVSGQCIDPPRSKTDYAFYNYGAVLLDDGTEAAVGHLSIGGGHAAPRANLRQTLAHYDSTSTACADVTATNGVHGVWVCGWVRPGTSDEMVTALRASAISGDWRPIGPGGQLELVAALAVNVPGFGIPRTQIAAEGGRQLSLVAAGIVPPTEDAQREVLGLDMNAFSEEIALQVAEHLGGFQARRELIAAIAAGRED